MDRPVDIALFVMRARGWNQTQLAEKVGASSSDVTNWKSRDLPTWRHGKIADALGITIDQLTGRQPLPEDLTKTASSPVKTHPEGKPEGTGGSGRPKIDDELEDAEAPPDGGWSPVVGDVLGGPDGFFDEYGYPPGHGDGRVPNASRDKSAYARRVRGDSMAPKFSSGDRILVVPGVEAQPGDTVVVRLKDQRKALKKLLYIRDGEAAFGSLNPGYPGLTESLDKIESIHKVAAIYPR